MANDARHGTGAVVSGLWPVVSGRGTGSEVRTSALCTNGTRHARKPANPTKPPLHSTTAARFLTPSSQAQAAPISTSTCKALCICDRIPELVNTTRILPATMSSSADTTPISPARFAAALKELSIAMLHLKVLEIRNSIAHLQYSNDQLKPFAEGSATALSETDTSGTSAPDQDCIDAIKENDQVIDRMAERIAIIRVEVEDRGLSWEEFQSRDEAESKKEDEPEKTNGTTPAAPTTNASASGTTGDPWSDGTFQVGTIRNGELHMDGQASQPAGGSLSDEQLRRALEERMRDLGTDDDNEGGMHL